MKRQEILQDYIETQKILNIAKQSCNLAYFDLICKLNKVSNILYKVLNKKESDKYELQVLNSQIRKLYISNVKNQHILFLFSQNIDKIKKQADIYTAKYCSLI